MTGVMSQPVRRTSTGGPIGPSSTLSVMCTHSELAKPVSLDGGMTKYQWPDALVTTDCEIGSANTEGEVVARGLKRVDHIESHCLA